MKMLIIERVRNGWIIRPVAPSLCVTVADPSEVYVFATVEAMQEAMPGLLGNVSEIIDPLSPNSP